MFVAFLPISIGVSLSHSLALFSLYLYVARGARARDQTVGRAHLHSDRTDAVAGEFTERSELEPQQPAMRGFVEQVARHAMV